MAYQDSLLRQIHPNFDDRGKVSSQAFRPTEEHDFRLSTYDGQVFVPEQAIQHYRNEKRNKTNGVMGIEKYDIDSRIIILNDNSDFEEHILLDFQNLSGKEIRKVSKILKRRAEERGWILHYPEGE